VALVSSSERTQRSGIGIGTESSTMLSEPVEVDSAVSVGGRVVG
jgi:hypothetical protein